MLQYMVEMVMDSQGAGSPVDSPIIAAMQPVEYIPVMRLEDILTKLMIIRPRADQQFGIQHPGSRPLSSDPIGKAVIALAASLRGESVASLERILVRPLSAGDLEQKGVAPETDAMAHMQGRQLGHGLKAAKGRPAV